MNDSFIGIQTERMNPNIRPMAVESGRTGKNFNDEVL